MKRKTSSIVALTPFSRSQIPETRIKERYRSEYRQSPGFSHTAAFTIAMYAQSEANRYYYELVSDILSR